MNIVVRIVLLFCVITRFLSASAVAARPVLTCPAVAISPFFSIVYGSATLDGAPAPAGTIVFAFSPRGDVVGCFSINLAGNYGAMYIYGEDTSVTPGVPGMRTGETVAFSINNGQTAATPPLIWNGDKNIHTVNLNAQINSADLAVSINSLPASLRGGQSVTFTLTAVNTGPASASGVTLTAGLPNGFSLVSITPGQGICGTPTALTCVLGGLASGANASVSIQARAAAGLLPGSAAFSASIHANENDPLLSNNSQTFTVNILNSRVFIPSIRK